MNNKIEIILIILLIIYIIYTKIKNYKNKELNNNLSPTPSDNYKNYYKPKRYLITLNELKFYKVLQEIAKELNLEVFSQVSLYNIILTKKELDNKQKYKYFNKIASKSIDFVLVDPNDCKIKLCIELDDVSHNRFDRIKRDEFINELFKQLEIDLLRYPTYQVYYKEALKNKIIENIKDHYYIN
ncbi:MAG: DUF2726 domain-containing protein [Clostridia bacterium]|nr:DUF2726 domain-containing protein [Clostridia bacterium]